MKQIPLIRERYMEDNSWLVGDVVVVDSREGVGEITKKSETADGEYTYMVAYKDGSAVWVSCEDICFA